MVYNLALQARSEAWTGRRERVGYDATSAMLTAWKRTRSAFRLRNGELTLAKMSEPLPVLDSAVGIDVGLDSLLVLSSGEKIANPRYERRDRVALARAQRSLSRKQSGSKNRDKARIKVARIHS
jgi:transposase